VVGVVVAGGEVGVVVVGVVVEQGVNDKSAQQCCPGQSASDTQLAPHLPFASNQDDPHLILVGVMLNLVIVVGAGAIAGGVVGVEVPLEPKLVAA